MDTLPDAYGVGLPIPSRRELQKRRREIFRKEHPLPARESVGFEMALGSRIAWYLRDKGIVNNSQINALRDRALNEWKKDEQVNIWLIVRRISKPRIALNKVLREMHEQGRHEYIKQMFVAAKLIGLTLTSEWRNHVHQFESDEKALKWAENFIDQNRGNDIDTAYRSLKAYSIQPPPPVPPAIIAQAPDPARDNAQAAQRKCRDCGGRELISMKTGNWYCPKCNPREENPVTDQPAPVSELDIHIPRCKIHNKPVVDELTGICEQCEVEARERPKHWSQSTGTFKKVAARFQKRKESATVPDYMAAIKEWFEVESMTQLDMTEEAFYVMLDNELEARFDKGKKQNASETPKNAPISQPSPPTPTTPVSTKIERSSEANQPIEDEIEEVEFVDTTPRALVVRPPETSFTGRALFPTKSEQSVMSELADDAYRSGLLPKQIKSVHAAKFIVETGRELGIPASLALRKLHLINGNLGMAAELMWAMVLNSGKLEDFEIAESESSCTVMVKRMGMRPYNTTFNLDMARKMITTEYDNGQPKRIPLADKPTWKQMPGVMCKWRALSVACRTVFPDITLGLYSREELEDSIDFNAQPELAPTG